MVELFLRRVFKFVVWAAGFGVLTWALHNGIEDGWFGDTIRLVFGDLKKVAAAFYEEYSGVVSNAGPALGIAATLLSGVWAIHKGLYFANHNLPLRLQEYLDRKDERLRDDYSRMLAVVRPPLLRPGYGATAVSPQELSVFFKSKGFGKPPSAQAELQARLNELTGQVKTASDYYDGFTREQVRAHILLGATLVSDAEVLHSASATSVEPLSHRVRQMHHRALEEFDAALKIDADNLDALELRAAQLATLGEPTADQALEDLRAAAEAQSDPVREARALRLLAEKYEQRGVRSQVNSHAKQLISDAKDLLADLSHPGIDLEKALTCETAGRIREMIGQLPSARGDYNTAIDHYRKVPTDFARQKVTELEDKLKSLG